MKLNTIWWCPEGPLLKYEPATFVIEDLNPDVKITWRMSRFELFKIGLRCILIAIRGAK